MPKLQKEFLSFNDDIKLVMTEPLAEKRDILTGEIESKFPSECENKGINVKKSELNFIYQGSYPIKTAIDDNSGTLDVDVAMSFPLDISIHDDPRILKKCVKEALARHNRTVNIKKPCITIPYHENGEEIFHVDFPLYAVYYDNYYLAVGKEFSEDYEWQDADPKGLIKYFTDKLKGKQELRRIIRFLKKWKSEKFSSGSNGSPPSIALTILACEFYTEYYDDDENYDELRTLYEVVKQIKDAIPFAFDDDGRLEVFLPVKPENDTMFKINSNKNHRQTFVTKVNYFENQLRNALNASSEHKAGEYVAKVLGNEFPLPEKESVSGANSYGRRAEFG